MSTINANTLVTTDHPSYPLQREQASDILDVMIEFHQTELTECEARQKIDAINSRYYAYRKAEFPDWLERYERQMQNWFGQQRNGTYQRLR